MKLYPTAFLTLVILLGGCDTVSQSRLSPSETESPTPLYDEAREAREKQGLDSAIPAYEAAADDGNGVAAVVLWDYYGQQNRPALAEKYKELSLSALGGRAWEVWASQPNELDEADSIERTRDRLLTGASQGSTEAEQSLARLYATLERESNDGNPSSQKILNLLNDESREV